jgi:hypothetical protein
VRRIFLRAVFSLYRKRAAQEAIPGGRTGAVNRIQGFGSSLNLNVHFHALVLDGVYTISSPFASGRLKWSRRGRLLYELRNPWRDGTTHLVFEPHVFLERLAALIPPPRAHLQTYHGVLAPSASWRDDVVMSPVRPAVAADSSEEEKRSFARRPPHRYLWPELMRRVFGFEVLRCKVCRSKRHLISMITECSVIVRILAHLGLQMDPAPIQLVPQMVPKWLVTVTEPTPV